jgi:hypothetical protein
MGTSLTASLNQSKDKVDEAKELLNDALAKLDSGDADTARQIISETLGILG